MYPRVSLRLATIIAISTVACGSSGDAGQRTVDSCFASGTRIATPAGEVAIETLRVGQRVYAYDHVARRVAVSTVTRTWTHGEASYRVLQLPSGQTVGVTSNHPIYRADTESYVPAGHLAGGDRVVQLDGESRAESTVMAAALDAPLAKKLWRGTVHNISVARYENYFANKILVHNKTYFTDAPDRRVEVTRMGPEFGAVPLGCTASTTFTVTYNGTGVSSPLSVALEGAASNDYALVDDKCGSVSLPAGATCAVEVSLTPSAVGRRLAHIVASAGSGGGEGQAEMSGEGAASGGIVISPSRHDFNNSTVGGQPDQFSFTVTNASDGQVDGISASVTGDDVVDFAIVDDGCVDPVPGHCDRCTVVGEFKPASAGNKRAELTVATSPVGGGTTARLYGLASLADATLEVVPSVNDFGAVVVGDRNTLVALRVTNIGALATGPIGITLSGPHAADFPLAVDECVPPYDGLQGGVGAECLVLVKFVPLATGPRTATVSVTASPGGSVNVNLSGTGVMSTAFDSR